MHRASILLALLLALVSVEAPADEGSTTFSQDIARRAVARGEIRPLSDIIAIARRDFSAPLVEVEFERKNGRYIYELVLLAADGALIELYYDAATGALLEIEREGGSRLLPSLFEDNGTVGDAREGGDQTSSKGSYGAGSSNDSDDSDGNDHGGDSDNDSDGDDHGGDSDSDSDGDD